MKKVRLLKDILAECASASITLAPHNWPFLLCSAHFSLFSHCLSLFTFWLTLELEKTKQWKTHSKQQHNSILPMLKERLLIDMWANNTANSASITLALKWMICSAIFHSLNQKINIFISNYGHNPTQRQKKRQWWKCNSNIIQAVLWQVQLIGAHIELA